MSSVIPLAEKKRLERGGAKGDREDTNSRKGEKKKKKKKNAPKEVSLILPGKKGLLNGRKRDREGKNEEARL